ncbi:MAG: hypothetical protein KF893_17630 [Caldilineaceae bacterium]|nr:hypothetical protein [Caldilineaceae bacterium]
MTVAASRSTMVLKWNQGDIERAVASQPMDVAEVIARARRLHMLTAAHPLDEDRLQQFINMGKP